MGYVKNTIYSSVNRVIYGHVVRARGGGVPVYSSVTCNQLDVTEEYTFILLGTDEYMGIYSST
jgi:hypothetical protein